MGMTEQVRELQVDNENLQALNARFLSCLAREYGETQFNAYFRDMSIASASSSLVTFETGSEVRCALIGRHHLVTMKDIWNKTIGPVDRVAIKLRPEISANLTATARKSREKEMRTPFFIDRPANGAASGTALPADQARNLRSRNGGGEDKKALPFEMLLSPVNTQNTFDSFAVDASNELACAAARKAILESEPDDNSANHELIYIYGMSGIGKTHLLHAIANENRRRNPDLLIAYFDYNNVQNGCVDALLSNGATEFHRRFMQCHVVLIDDIHLLYGKEKTQEQLLTIIDTCLASGVQLAVAGDLAPKKLIDKNINQRLADRLAGGLSVGIQTGGPHLRCDVLKKRLDREKAVCRISSEALDFVVANFNHSMREAIGGLNQLLLSYRNCDITVDLPMAREALRDKLSEGRKVLSVDDLLAVTSEVMGVSIEDMKGKARPQPIVRARHAFVYCGREYLKQSLPQLSRALNRDHTTALSSARRAAALLERDKIFCKQVDQIRERIEL